MASPQVEHGFVMIALDLHVAIMTADLPNRCMIVLAEVLLHCYGPDKASSVRLEPISVEDRTGLRRNNARRALVELVASRVLIRESDHSYRFNKDYESWELAGERFASRLGGSLVRFARSAVGRFGAKTAPRRQGIPIKSSENFAIHPESASTSTPIPLESPYNCHVTPVGVTLQLSCDSNGIGVDVDMRKENRDASPNEQKGYVASLAHGRAPASEDQKIRDKKRGEEDAPPLRSSPIPGIGKPLAQGPPSRLEQSASLDGSLPGDVIPDEAQLATVRLRAEDWFPCDHGLTNAIELHRRVFTTAWMLRAMKRLKLQGKTNVGGLFRTILSGWHRDGGPDRGPEDEYDDDLRLLKPSQRKPHSQPPANGRAESPPLYPRVPPLSDAERRRVLTIPPRPSRPPPPGNVGARSILERLDLPPNGTEAQPR